MVRTEGVARRSLLLAAMASVCVGARGQALAAPAGSPVLTLRGKVKRTNRGDSAVFDMAMLEAVMQHSFSTKTPWFKEARKFTGPLLRDLLALAGAHGTTLRVSALNDYRIDIPIDDARRFDVMLARLVDDRPITVREKGPLFMIYPFDSDPALRNALYYSRSVWQLKTIDVV
jgi:hypothetical protein